MKKLLLVLLLAVFMASPVWAGNFPEFDAVGNDAENFFATTNLPYIVVTEYFRDNLIDGWSLEDQSNFVKWEKFWQNAGALRTDPCWGDFQSALATIQKESSFEWTIVLQMQPESDINVNIYDCVMKWEGARHEGIFGEAEQTGRFRATFGKLFFLPCANPSITVKAYPGPFAVPSFTSWQYLEARKMPGLWRTCLDEKWYTSKAHWNEGIVVALPQTGFKDERGSTKFQLVQGDRIQIRVDVPLNNTADIYYGADSVVLKYIGMSGTAFLDVDPQAN